MKELFDSRVAIIIGAILIAFGLVLVFLIFNTAGLSQANKSDYQWEAAIAVLVGLFFVNKGLKSKQKKPE